MTKINSCAQENEISKQHTYVKLKRIETVIKKPQIAFEAF